MAWRDLSASTSLIVNIHILYLYSEYNSCNNSTVENVIFPPMHVNDIIFQQNVCVCVIYIWVMMFVLQCINRRLVEILVQNIVLLMTSFMLC